MFYLVDLLLLGHMWGSIGVHWHGGKCLQRLVPNYAVVFRPGWLYLPVSLCHRRSRRRSLFLQGAFCFFSMSARFCGVITRESVFLWKFPFFNMTRSSLVQYHQFLAWNIRTVVFFRFFFIVFIIFLSHCMMSLLLLVAIIRSYFCVFLKSSLCSINVVLNIGNTSSSF